MSKILSKITFKASEFKDLKERLDNPNIRLGDNMEMVIRDATRVGDNVTLETNGGNFNHQSLLFAYIAVGDWEKSILNAGDDKLECVNPKSDQIVRVLDYLEENIGEDFVLPTTMKILKRTNKGANVAIMERDDLKAVYQGETIYQTAKAQNMETVPLYRKVPGQADGSNRYAPWSTFIFEKIAPEVLEEIKKAVASEVTPETVPA